MESWDKIFGADSGVKIENTFRFLLKIHRCCSNILVSSAYWKLLLRVEQYDRLNGKSLFERLRDNRNANIMFAGKRCKNSNHAHYANYSLIKWDDKEILGKPWNVISASCSIRNFNLGLFTIKNYFLKLFLEDKFLRILTFKNRKPKLKRPSSKKTSNFLNALFEIKTIKLLQTLKNIERS